MRGSRIPPGPQNMSNSSQIRPSMLTDPASMPNSSHIQPSMLMGPATMSNTQILPIVPINPYGFSAITHHGSMQRYLSNIQANPSMLRDPSQMPNIPTRPSMLMDPSQLPGNQPSLQSMPAASIPAPHRNILATPHDIAMAARQTKIETLPPNERQEQEAWAVRQIALFGSCVAGFAWNRVPGGYVCSGRHHMITDELLAEGAGGFYKTDVCQGPGVFWQGPFYNPGIPLRPY